MSFKTTFLLIPLVILFNITTGQNKTFDSIKNALRQKSDDTNKVKDLISLSAALYSAAKFDSSVTYGKKAEELADKLNWQKGKGNALMVIGSAYDNQGNAVEALNWYNASLDIFKKNNNKLGIARCDGNLGNVYEELGNYPKALESLLDALSIFRDIKYDDGIANCYQNMGNVYTMLADYNKALDNYENALSIFPKVGDSSGIADCLQNIGNIYHQDKNYSKSLEYYFKSFVIVKKEGDSVSESHILGNVANVYTDKHSYDTAMKFALNALAITRKTGEQTEYDFDLETLAYIYLYEKMSDRAKLYFDSALHVAQRAGDKEHAKDIYFQIAGIDSAKGDFRTAWQDYKNYVKLRDSLVNQATIKKTTQAEMNFEFNRKTDSTKAVQDKINAVKEKESQRQKVIRNGFIAGFSLAFLASGVFFFQRKKITKEKKRSDELLLNILPEEVAEELKEKGNAEARHFDEVTVMFTDFKGFTTIGEKLTPKELINELNHCFVAYDNIIYKHNIEKIKTIGDAYMAVCGLPHPDKHHAQNVVKACLQIIKFMEDYKAERIKNNQPYFEVRVGVNSGPVVAGIVGVKKFAYDIWGDTVNTAARMEQNSEAGKINISGSTYALVREQFACTHRGKIHAKNKGEIDMYFVVV